MNISKMISKKSGCAMPVDVKIKNMYRRIQKFSPKFSALIFVKQILPDLEGNKLQVFV